MISNKNTQKVTSTGSTTGLSSTKKTPSTGVSTSSKTSTTTTTGTTTKTTVKPLTNKSTALQNKTNLPTKEEEKKEAPRSLGFTEKPTAKLRNIKVSDPFAPKSSMKTNSFAYVYNAGGIPCRIDHGSINHRLKWNADVNLEELSFDPLLITCFEGLVETLHPYNFIAKEAIKEMLTSPGASEKVIPILPRLIAPLRTALGHADVTVFENALATLKLLSDTVGDALNDQLSGVLGNLVKKMNDKKYKEKVIDVLHSIEENGGPSVVKIIKAKIPTYTNLN